MPIYEYRCAKGHTFEVMQRMSDDPVAECEKCGAPVQRVFHPVAVHFKGSGFYNTDYGKQKRAAASGGSEDGAGASDSKPAKKEDSSSKKTESAASSSSSSSSSTSSSSE